MKANHYKKELLYRKAQGNKRLNKFESKKRELDFKRKKLRHTT
ncbi:hypothetical protein [Pseudomonas shirazica]|nr:hypothetical protein [Pseudomonas shirazica]